MMRFAAFLACLSFVTYRSVRLAANYGDQGVSPLLGSAPFYTAHMTQSLPRLSSAQSD